MPAIDEFKIPGGLYHSTYDSSKMIADHALSEDIMEYQRYKMQILGLPPSDWKNYDYIKAADHVCILPSFLENEKKQKVDPQKIEKRQKKRIMRWIKALIPLKRKALLHKSGWWTYEFAYQKHIVQYHNLSPEERSKRPGIVRDEFMLGRFIPGSSEPYLDPTTSKLVQNYNGGDICHLPGDIRGPERWTQVYFKCDSSSTSDYIEDVVEISTCRYVMTIASPRFCPLMETDHKENALIMCFSTLEASRINAQNAFSDNEHSESVPEDEMERQRKRQHYIIRHVASNSEFPHFSRLVNDLLSDLGDIMEEISSQDSSNDHKSDEDSSDSGE